MFSLECVSTFAFFPAIFLCEPYDEDAPKSVGVVEYVGGSTQNNANGGSGAALSKSQKKKLKQKQSKQRKKGEDQVADGEEA